ELETVAPTARARDFERHRNRDGKKWRSGAAFAEGRSTGAARRANLAPGGSVGGGGHSGRRFLHATFDRGRWLHPDFENDGALVERATRTGLCATQSLGVRELGPDFALQVRSPRSRG